MLYFLLYVFYGVVGIWWSQVCSNMIPVSSGLDFDNMKKEKERFYALIKLLLHVIFWPLSILYLVFKTNKETVFTAMVEFNWGMTFRK